MIYLIIFSDVGVSNIFSHFRCFSRLYGLYRGRFWHFKIIFTLKKKIIGFHTDGSQTLPKTFVCSADYFLTNAFPPVLTHRG